MAVVISINDTNPKFTGLDMKHVSLTIGSVNHAPLFYNFNRRKAGTGDAGTNNKLLTVSKSFPLVFDNHDFSLLASKDTFHSAPTLSSMIDLMRKDLIKVTKDGVELTPANLLAYTP